MSIKYQVTNKKIEESRILTYRLLRKCEEKEVRILGITSSTMIKNHKTVMQLINTLEDKTFFHGRTHFRNEKGF